MSNDKAPKSKPQNRNTERILVSLYPEDLVRLDEIAEAIKEDGAQPNRSQAIRFALREVRKRERRLGRP